MKIILAFFLFICVTSFGQRSYLIPADDFISQFSDTSAHYRIYGINKKGEKIWLTNINNRYALSLELKGSGKKINLDKPLFKNGIIEGIQITTMLTRKLFSININEVSLIKIKVSYAVESPYFDIDSCRKIFSFKSDSLIKNYSDGKQFIIYLTAKNKSKTDSLLLCENACYNIVFRDNNYIVSGVIHKITKDSLYISNSFDSNTARKDKKDFRILAYSNNDIKSLKLLKGNSISFYIANINDYNTRIEEVEKNKSLIPCWFTINPITGETELYRNMLTLVGFYGIKEKNGILYWYEK
jgi:hypothetical protein